MEASNFRIGNLVKYKSELYGISQIFNYGRLCLGQRNLVADEVDLIPLTEDWFLKFKFRKYESWYDGFIQKYGYRLIENDEYLVSPLDEDLSSWELVVFGEYENEFGTIGTKPFKYVHQLQNLYFALKGIELQQIEI